MLNKNEIREAILDRAQALSGSCNSAHIDHNDGVLRGLIWALTGDDPGTDLTRNMLKVFKLSGIDVKRVGDHIEYEMPCQ
jgi:hypothetical protein